jgi:hypothetical protein
MLEYSPNNFHFPEETRITATIIKSGIIGNTSNHVMPRALDKKISCMKCQISGQI